MDVRGIGLPYNILQFCGRITSRNFQLLCARRVSCNSFNSEGPAADPAAEAMGDIIIGGLRPGSDFYRKLLKIESTEVIPRHPRRKSGRVCTLVCSTATALPACHLRIKYDHHLYSTLLKVFISLEVNSKL